MAGFKWLPETDIACAENASFLALVCHHVMLNVGPGSNLETGLSQLSVALIQRGSPDREFSLEVLAAGLPFDGLGSLFYKPVLKGIEPPQKRTDFTQTLSDVGKANLKLFP